MRGSADAASIERLARELGRVVPPGTKMYLTGGATAVLEGWRPSTVDVEVRFEPDSDAALRPIAELKERLQVNVELASPLDFLPPLEGWRDRSRFRLREGNLEVFDFDPYSQALSKLERGFELDLQDVAAMMHSGLVDRTQLLELYEGIEPQLFNFPLSIQLSCERQSRTSRGSSHPPPLMAAATSRRRPSLGLDFSVWRSA